MSDVQSSAARQTDAGGEAQPAPANTRKRFLVGAAATGAAFVGPTVLGPARAVAARKRTRRSRREGDGQRLSASETATLEAWCDVLVPGARQHGVGGFVNDQLVKPHEDALLLLRYQNWFPPYDRFYRESLAAVDTASETRFGRRFLDLTEAERNEVVGGLLSGQLPWTGPPPVFRFYFVTRNDAVDVVYGTVEGFARIDFPYQALIEPKRPW